MYLYLGVINLHDAQLSQQLFTHQLKAIRATDVIFGNSVFAVMSPRGGSLHAVTGERRLFLPSQQQD